MNNQKPSSRPVGMQHPFGVQTASYQHIGARWHQEDAQVTLRASDGYLAGVFDGHGGGSVSASAAAYFGPAFEKSFRKVSPVDDRVTERRVLRLTMLDLLRRHRKMDAGSTASVAWIRAAGYRDRRLMLRIHIAIIGDSPVGVWDGSRLHVPRLHSPNFHQRDLRRIQRWMAAHRDHADFCRADIGRGYVWRDADSSGAEGLAVTRAMGDRSFGDLLIRRPEIYSYEAACDDFVLLLASDGILTESASPAAVRRKMRSVFQALHGEGLPVEEAAHRHGQQAGDNVTLLAIRGAPNPVEEAAIEAANQFIHYWV